MHGDHVEDVVDTAYDNYKHTICLDMTMSTNITKCRNIQMNTLRCHVDGVDVQWLHHLYECI
jgi:hypothetical protein